MEVFNGDFISVDEQVGQSQFGKRRRLQFEAPQPKNDKKFAHNTRNSSLNVSKPSGIGLHLNSVVNAMPLSYPCDGGEKSISISSRMQDNIKKCPSISSNSNLLENDSSKCEENAHEASKARSLTVIECEEKFDQVSLKSEQAEKVDEMNGLNPKKKRKKTESSGEGCKFCNCKKTRCLKLYCDCFAAGIYCADSCSCQGCFNRPEYEETVLETRQQIESRNPIAFAPKIVHRITQSPRTQMEDGDQLTSIAGRHKRGCSCKKSMCLKKYCECYQANVGCSDGCRCEGCKNIYGTKGVGSIIGEMGMEAINEKLNDSFDVKLKVGSHKPHNSTPPTPFQCSNHGKNVPKAFVFPGKYVLSPESECTFYPNPYNTCTPTSPNDSDMITEASNKYLEMVPFDQESYPNIELTDEFSPGDWSNNNSSRPQLLGCSSVSVCFRGSPVTLFSGTKLSFGDIIDDNSNTPEILKDSSCIQQPNKVIATSPNKKRVSPPRIRLHELGSTSLKSGRKFILKAVPSFPPLTPCIDSKDNNGGQNLNHPSGNNNLQKDRF